MKFIEEIVVEEFLPTFRSMLAAELRDRGLTQSEVADALGISQSAVSKYAHGDVARRDEFTDDERVRELVARIGEGLTDGEMRPVQALVETEVLIRRLENGDILATLHEESVPELSEYGGGFNIHDPESELRTTERVLASLRRGLRRLENTSGFATLIPNVGSNLVACTPDAADVDDVAGVPGRIFDVKGQATVPGDPEFGVSEHVASVLLAARRAGNDARAALNVRYDPDIVEQLEHEGYETAEFDGEVDADEAVTAALADTPDADVLYQTGGYGVEPIVYVLGPDAETAAERVRGLV
jgi:predicted fused transcriptional regulator/phosphomethylpyrimidine kinase/predicted transcriptional regulator